MEEGAKSDMITDRLLDFICSLRYEEISDEAMQKLRQCLVDTIGVTIAGSAELEDKNKKLQILLGGNAIIRPIGSREKTSLSNAIFINGLNSHILELDDGIRYGVIHPSAPMFSALIPIACLENVSWEQFALGSICGYEVSCRLAHAMQPSHYSRGYHPTATCCTIGTAVGIAVMLGFSQKETKDALSAATISASGTLKVLDDVSQLKAYNCAKAALNGYYAAMLAKSGFAGPKEPLEGKLGFLDMMSDAYNTNIITANNDWLYVEKIYQKPYASCRHTHPEIEAAFSIRQDSRFKFDEIAGVDVYTYKGVIGKHDTHDIYGEASARMSIPYSVAIALYTGRAGIAEFTSPFVEDEQILSLSKYVNILADDTYSAMVPDKRCARVEVRMMNGEVLTDTVEYPKGEPENPMSDEDLRVKFMQMCQYGHYDSQKANTVFETVMNGEKIEIKDLL